MVKRNQPDVTETDYPHPFATPLKQRQPAGGEEKKRQISSTMYPSHILSDEHDEYFKKVIDELLTGYKSPLG